MLEAKFLITDVNLTQNPRQDTTLIITFSQVVDINTGGLLRPLEFQMRVDCSNYTSAMEALRSRSVIRMTLAFETAIPQSTSGILFETLMLPPS